MTRSRPLPGRSSPAAPRQKQLRGGLAIATLCTALHGGAAQAAAPTAAPKLASATPPASLPTLAGDGAPAPSRPLPANPIIPVREVRPGMTGYGLTVFKGTHPERFAVRVIGVLRNFLPQMDLILIDSDDPRLVHSGIAAGMSGSPIYLDGRLAGALAYGWHFGKDPVAGVTPIERMLTDMRRPLRGRTGVAMAQADPADATVEQWAAWVRVAAALGVCASLEELHEELVEAAAETFPSGLPSQDELRELFRAFDPAFGASSRGGPEPTRLDVPYRRVITFCRAT